VASGARIVPTPLMEGAIDVRALYISGAGAAYVTPSHQFPTGEEMSAAQRAALLRWAQETGGYILEDDYDSEFRFSGVSAPALRAMDESGQVIYMNTFARTLASGLRLSFMVLPQALVERYRALHAVVAGAGVEITEVVASNAKYAPDENGAFHDYFELHNTTGEPIDLSGWFVSDVMGQPTKWRVPDGVTLQPGEYRVIYASGLDRADAAYLHTSFGLSSEGEAVVLANPEGKVADCVEFDLLKTNQAWVRQADNTWTTGTPTPNAENG